MNTDTISFFKDFHPSLQDWSQVNRHIEDDLCYEFSETTTLPPSQSIQDFISCYESQLAEETVASITYKTDKKHQSDNNYQKNICSYISKKIVHDLINPKSEKLVRKMCSKTGCNFQAAMKYYTKKSKEIFGINHLNSMINPQNEEQINIKRMFCLFLNWFLRNRYMFYMLKFGKMQEKQKYIEFKNKYLLYIVDIQSGWEKYL